MRAHQALAASGAGLLLGRCLTIGLAGVTLGGLACDHLEAVGIVTAEGRIRPVRPDSPPRATTCPGPCAADGNFGVVTALEFATSASPASCSPATATATAAVMRTTRRCSA
ncbi:hypothetical protein [Streptomyces niveiscabiei]|uniref:Uncharacterized protein n=1 Tax=Streptomyces niveiscabiei TaxID=164115 RepID=A0ABW9HGF6_9ACTN